MVIFILVIATSIWVLVDAQQLDVKKGSIKGFWGMGAIGWFIACLLIWIVAFPAYLGNRPKYKRLHDSGQVIEGEIVVETLPKISATNTQKNGWSTVGKLLTCLLIALTFLLILGMYYEPGVPLKAIPSCNSEQFAKAVTDIIGEKVSYRIVKAVGKRNTAILPKEHHITKNTGAEWSNCVAFLNTDDGYKTYNVLMCKETSDADVHFDFEEIDHTLADLAVKPR